MNIQMLINRGCIAMDAGIRGLFKLKNTKSKKKQVLIVFQQVFGDAIMLSNSLQSYLDVYPQSEGYQITLLVRPSVAAFMKATVPLPDKIKLELVDFKKFLEDYSYYREIISRYCCFADTVIVPGSSFSAEVLTAACRASRKIGLVRSFPVKKPFVMAYFNRIAYTERVVPEPDLMMLQRHRQLLHHLGLKSYQAKLPVLLPKARIIDAPQYAVVCLGASIPEKCWPVERYCQVIDYLVEKYDMSIHLCGGIEEQKYEAEVLRYSRNAGRIVSHIGKTDFSDWSAIVQHADLVLGNDSATMHLAAAARVPALCITGVYDKFQFFPYNVDYLAPGDRLPVTLYQDMPCQWCRTVGYYAGYGNPQCKARINKGECTICIDCITVQQVTDAVDKLLKGRE